MFFCVKSKDFDFFDWKHLLCLCLSCSHLWSHSGCSLYFFFRIICPRLERFSIRKVTLPSDYALCELLQQNWLFGEFWWVSPSKWRKSAFLHFVWKFRRRIILQNFCKSLFKRLKRHFQIDNWRFFITNPLIVFYSLKVEEQSPSFEFGRFFTISLKVSFLKKAQLCLNIWIRQLYSLNLGRSDVE